MILSMHSAILEHLTTQWAGATPLQAPNEKLYEGDPPWIRATFLPVGSEQAEIGENGSARHDSILVVDIFTGLGIGTGEAVGYADTITNMFRRNTRLTKDGLTAVFAEPEHLAGRENDSGDWQMPIHCPWYVYYQN